MAKHGVKIISVQSDSLAERIGLRPGDTLLSINDHQINDEIDVMFNSQESEIYFTIKRNGREISCEGVVNDSYEGLGIELQTFKINKCRNRCLFCFVSQLPKGMRKTLYVRDEDYRMSFLYGNYLTLSNLSDDDKKRITDQRMSPIYISVHTTNNELRSTLLKNKNLPDIMKEIRYFVKHKIKLHTQIVLCPGYNDGEELKKSIKDLGRFYPYLASIAVVPVGITRYSKGKLKPVTKGDALLALDLIDAFRKRFFRKHGDAIVYAADELYLKAEVGFPSIKDYGDLSQIENGVGLVPYFNHHAGKMIKLPHVPQRRILTFTGVSFYPFLNNFFKRINKKYETNLKVIPVKNHFFGESITVTGLLTGRDVVRKLMDHVNGDEVLLIPDVVLRNGEDMFLDDITVDFIAETFNTDVRVIESTVNGFIKMLREIE